MCGSILISNNAKLLRSNDLKLVHGILWQSLDKFNFRYIKYSQSMRDTIYSVDSLSCIDITTYIVSWGVGLPSIRLQLNTLCWLTLIPLRTILLFMLIVARGGTYLLEQPSSSVMRHYFRFQFWASQTRVSCHFGCQAMKPQCCESIIAHSISTFIHLDIMSQICNVLTSTWHYTCLQFSS